jgi:FMN-dependent oxidoreductase (nitrilotriacetate monooxygenase family)
MLGAVSVERRIDIEHRRTGMSQKQMRIGMSLRGHGYHLAAWRHPNVPADASVRIDHYVRTAQTAERGKCDLIFFADGLGIRERDVPRGALARQGRDIVDLDPLTLLPALAMVTHHIGLVATVSTTYNEPYHVARTFASLDLISQGRAGWNVVTSWSEAEAQNFNRATQLDYATRYERAREFVDVVKGLWDSWDADAFLYDKMSGLFYDERKLHVLQHQGKYFTVRGPLNVAPAPQRHPVIVQAGASPDGRELAAATADVVYCLPDTLEAARAYYVDVKGRMRQYGRAPDDLKILPGLRPTVGRTTAEAHAKFNALQALLDPLVGLSTLASTFGDLSGYPLDGPVPLERHGPQDLRSISERLIARVRHDQPTIRQLSQQVAGMGSGFTVIGTAEEIANVMQAWFEQGACDGFNITPTHLPGGCDDFVNMVIPVLQERGLFRTAYEGATLREHLGLKPAVSRYARAPGLPAAE